ncbi:hypothetical protein [Streptomyces sp. 4F14]|uniref:hypothetical protein n=1 Tax=Streptomyces sp. 4F14 TaxID=3394380 RepID=UPI003A87DA25
MAQRRPRKSAREVEAREKVRARRAAHRQREQQLEDLATDYEVTVQEIRDVTEAAEERIAAYTARLRGEAETSKRELRERQAASIGRMLALDGARSVADRLGEPVETVRKAASSTAGATESGKPELGRATAQSAGRPSATAQPVTGPAPSGNMTTTASPGPGPAALLPSGQRAAVAGEGER